MCKLSPVYLSLISVFQSSSLSSFAPSVCLFFQFFCFFHVPVPLRRCIQAFTSRDCATMIISTYIRGLKYETPRVRCADFSRPLEVYPIRLPQPHAEEKDVHPHRDLFCDYLFSQPSKL